MLRHFPCHGADARPHSSRVFHSNLKPKLAQAMRVPRLEPPASRRHHAAVAFGGEHLLLHGGNLYKQASHPACADVHLLHVPSMRWAQPPMLFLTGSPPITGASFAPPPRRCGHCAQVVEMGAGSSHAILMFGGLDEAGNACGDTWVVEL